MTKSLDESRATLLIEASRALGVTQEELGRRIGVSRRSIVRWTADSGGYPSYYGPHLARAVFPRDPALAARIAGREKETLESLGLVSPAPPPPPPEPPAHMADLVVCAAADALDVSPRAVRPALYAAFRRAREAGLTLEQVEKMLAPPEATPAPKKRAKKGG